jgi:hypothetical protein
VREFFEFNVLGGGYVGDETPVFVDLLREA